MKLFLSCRIAEISEDLYSAFSLEDHRNKKMTTQSQIRSLSKPVPCLQLMISCRRLAKAYKYTIYSLILPLLNPFSCLGLGDGSRARSPCSTATSGPILQHFSSLSTGLSWEKGILPREMKPLKCIFAWLVDNEIQPILCSLAETFLPLLCVCI